MLHFDQSGVQYSKSPGLLELDFKHLVISSMEKVFEPNILSD